MDIETEELESRRKLNKMLSLLPDVKGAIDLRGGTENMSLEVVEAATKYLEEELKDVILDPDPNDDVDVELLEWLDPEGWFEYWQNNEQSFHEHLVEKGDTDAVPTSRFSEMAQKILYFQELGYVFPFNGGEWEPTNYTKLRKLLRLEPQEADAVIPALKELSAAGIFH